MQETHSGGGETHSGDGETHSVGETHSLGQTHSAGHGQTESTKGKDTRQLSVFPKGHYTHKDNLANFAVKIILQENRILWCEVC